MSTELEAKRWELNYKLNHTPCMNIKKDNEVIDHRVTLCPRCQIVIEIYKLEQKLKGTERVVGRTTVVGGPINDDNGFM